MKEEETISNAEVFLLLHLHHPWLPKINKNRCKLSLKQVLQRFFN